MLARTESGMYIFPEDHDDAVHTTAMVRTIGLK